MQMSAGRRRHGPCHWYVNDRSWPRRACDDRRLVGLRLIFLIVTRAVLLLGLSRRESWWKDAEILMLRHQFAVAERDHPGATEHPVQAWVVQQARNLLMDLEDAGTRVKFVLHDRDASSLTGRWSGNQRHLMIVLREYEDFYNTHRPHRTLKQAAPLRPLPDGVTDLGHFRVHRRDRAGGVIHEYRLVA
jgi:hypothetical protein